MFTITEVTPILSEQIKIGDFFSFLRIFSLTEAVQILITMEYDSPKIGILEYIEKF